MTIECAFIGRLGAPPQRRMTKAGKPWAAISVAVDQGGEQPPEWIQVAVFEPVLEELPADAVKGERVYCEGRLRLNRWAPEDGTERSTLQVSATRVLVLDRIGRRRRPSRSRKARADSQAPLTGCERAAISEEASYDLEGRA